jgi:hypothetical protein
MPTVSTDGWIAIAYRIRWKQLLRVPARWLANSINVPSER